VFDSREQTAIRACRLAEYHGPKVTAPVRRCSTRK
jgi:hypothetical protein